MEIIFHRRNNLELLNNSPKIFGIEVDIRSHGKELIINHNPYEKGILFSSWIKHYKHGTLILNLKEDGLEEKVLVYLKKYNIKSYFFLDQSMPSIIKTSSKGNPNCAVRVSEYESIETALNLKGIVDWVWVDIFSKFPLNKESYLKLKNANFKICLVSPELQNSNQLQISDLKNYLEDEIILFDAVCTKFPENWIDKNFLK